MTHFLHPSNAARILLAALLCIALPVFARADADADWKAITAMDAGPDAQPKTRDEALKATLAQITRQEAALRAFIKAYPGDPHGIEARMRVSHLLAIRSDLELKPELYDQALKILDDLLASPALPKEKLPDVAYDRVTLMMHHAQDPDGTEREALLSQVLKFQKDYPTDHRNGDLLVAVAAAYDDAPEKERDLLNQAIRYANADLKAEIGDDLKRLEMVGHPLKLKFDSVQGQEINIEAYRGKVVLIYFFAGGSPPSVMGLGPVKEIADGLAKTGEFQLLAISLDDKKEMLDAILKKTGLNCPVYFDGKGWDSALPRSLGINRLPTVWLVDKHGNLRVLNAINNTEALVRGLMREEQ